MVSKELNNAHISKLKKQQPRNHGAQKIINRDNRSIQEKKVEEDKWVFVEGCKHPKSVTLLLRAGSQRVVDEVERSVHDSIMVVRDVMEFPSI